ncbi:MAG: TIGR03984 family CRISPR-associated protein [Anaerolineae bacterium]|nr:TIGR03984 family CRISPR-associated protein [Anaerolineae bacterium]
MKRAISPIQSEVTAAPVAEFAANPESWLAQQATQHQLKYLLAHADDGVIWGVFDGNRFAFSSGVAPNSPDFRTETLRSLRLFGEQAELLLWRDDTIWHSRLVVDGAGPARPSFTENQMLWGTEKKGGSAGFTWLVDGSQGQSHAVPLDLTDEHFNRPGLDLFRPVRLRVRHYLGREAGSAGMQRIILSRLVDLYAEEPKR